MVQAWIALERQLPTETTRLCREIRPLLEGSGWVLVTQMVMLFGGAAALGEGRLTDAARDLEGLRDWHARERLILDWVWEPHLHICLSELALHQRDLERATAEALAAQQAAISMPDRSWRARANVMAALVAIERGAHDEAGQHLRQARRDVRGIDAPLVSWRIEAVTATLYERTAHPDSARRAREKLERAWQRVHAAPAPAPGNDLDQAQSGPYKPAN
jgi:hypothetical protein